MYKCVECHLQQEKTTICSKCFAQVKYIPPEKKLNTMDKERAIKFLKSEQFRIGKSQRSEKIYNNYKDVIDLIQKGIPDKNQGKLF